MMHFPAVKLSKSKVQEERVVTVYSSPASKLKKKERRITLSNLHDTTRKFPVLELCM